MDEVVTVPEEHVVSFAMKESFFPEIVLSDVKAGMK